MRSEEERAKTQTQFSPGSGNFRCHARAYLELHKWLRALGRDYLRYYLTASHAPTTNADSDRK